MKKILITGGSGLLALNWALTARDTCHVILGLHRRNVSLLNVSSQLLNLDDAEDLERQILKIGPDIVIHAAGLTSVEQCENDPGLAHHVNVVISDNVALVCAKLGIKFVLISTDHLFSGNDLLVNEDHPHAPINVYGMTKAEAELRVLERDSQSLVIRTNFYGWGTSYRQSFSDFILYSLRGNKDLSLFGDVFYTPILIQDLKSAVQSLLDLNAAGVYNVVGDERISKYDFGLKIAAQFNLDNKKIIFSSIEDQDFLVKRPKEMSLDNSKVCNVLGRKLGGVCEQILRLHQQEINGLAKELIAL
jgi:dTDP-4-dehydrorhamnose reductase